MDLKNAASWEKKNIASRKKAQYEKLNPIKKNFFSAFGNERRSIFKYTSDLRNFIVFLLQVCHTTNYKCQPSGLKTFVD